MGPPKKYFIEAKEEDVVVGTLEIKRKFDFATCIIGYFTYGIGLVFAWRFPDTVWVPTSENERRQNFDDAPRNSKPSPWDEPPKSNW